MRAPTISWFLPVVLAGQFLANLDTAIVNVATPAIGTTLHASGAELQLTVSAYVLASAMLLITAARLGTLFGMRRLFLWGLATFTLASLACGLAPDALLLIVARVVQGIGAALMLAQVLSGIQLAYPPGPERARAIGWYTMTLSASAVVGQILGGGLVTANLFGASWRPVFLINVPLGIVLFALALRGLPADRIDPERRQRLDGGGVALLSLAMLFVILPLTLGREVGWPAWTWIALILGAGMLWAFIWWERRIAARGGAPLIRLELFGIPAVKMGIAARACTLSAYFALLFVIALYLQDGLGASAFESGLALVSWVAAYGIAGPLFPRLPPALAQHAAPLGCLIMTLAFYGLSAATALGAGHGTALVVLLAIGGFGWGIVATSLIARITGSVTPAQAPALGGVLSTMLPLMAAFGVATFGGAYLSLTVHVTPAIAAHAFTIICAAFGCTTLVATFFAAHSSGGPR